MRFPAVDRQFPHLDCAADSAAGLALMRAFAETASMESTSISENIRFSPSSDAHISSSRISIVSIANAPFGSANSSRRVVVYLPRSSFRNPFVA